MKKIVRLTESDLVKLVKRVIEEQDKKTTTLEPRSAIGKIFKTMSQDTSCVDTVNKLRNVVTSLYGGVDFDTYKTTGTWGSYLSLLNKANSDLLSEINKTTKGTNPKFTSILSTSKSFGLEPKNPCVAKFQNLILTAAKGQNNLETESGKTEWIDGIVGLATLQSFVAGMIDFYESNIKSNPSLSSSPLVTQKTSGPAEYSGVQGVQQKVATRQY